MKTTKKNMNAISNVKYSIQTLNILPVGTATLPLSESTVQTVY